MEQFSEIKNNLNEKRETILNDWDKKILFEGGEGVLTKIIEDQGIPNVIILPETSARPLYYLFNPSFKKLSQKMKTEAPRFIFFNVSRPDWYTMKLEMENANWETDNVIDFKISSQDVKKHVDEIYTELYEEGFGLEKEKNLRSKETVDKTFFKREIEEKHAKELLKKIKEKYGENPKIIIIDDAIINARTTSDVRRAFDLKIPSYSIFAISGEGYGLNTKYGLMLPEEHQENPRTKLAKFSFGDGETRRASGVIKNKEQPFSTALNRTEDFTSEDQKKIIELRKEMEELGKKLADSLN